MAQAGRFTEAFTTFSPQQLNEFLCVLSRWALAFERIERGLSVAVRREALRIAGWVHPIWQGIYDEVFHT
ncbi:hypothetical protein [Trichocoleus sp. DQ-U1]|uniref:hypothetical protein n=1 Tax=Trichocoleus sp. DQ-U1 TaxID=2933926 RepID=UPI003297C007